MAKIQEAIKRYLLFIYEYHEQKGGINDFHDSYDTLRKAQIYGDNNCTNDQYYEVVDYTTLKIIYKKHW